MHVVREMAEMRCVAAMCEKRVASIALVVANLPTVSTGRLVNVRLELCFRQGWSKYPAGSAHSGLKPGVVVKERIYQLAGQG